MNCMCRLSKIGITLVLLCVVVILAINEGTYAQAAAIRDDSTLVVADVQLPQMLGAYSDVDKLNLGTLKNWYDDVNNNALHDPGESFAATAQSGWLRPTQAWDNSCWLASGVNMLKQLNLVGDANALYMNYALNGVPSPNGILTWDEGGLQEYVIQYWATQNPTVQLNMDVLWHSSTVQYGDGHYAWEDINIRSAVADYLSDGWQVGIGMWPLYSGGVHEGGHALTIQDVPAQTSPPYGTFDVTDSDNDGDWSGPGDLNTYADWTYGPGAFQGHNYYAWFNDFYSGNWSYWPDGDVGYVVAIELVPEPSTWILLAGITSMGLVWRMRRKA